MSAYTKKKGQQLHNAAELGNNDGDVEYGIRLCELEIRFARADMKNWTIPLLYDMTGDRREEVMGQLRKAYETLKAAKSEKTELNRIKRNRKDNNDNSD